MSIVTRAVALGVAALALTLAAAAPASAEGSVPGEVATFVADGSLLAQLDDIYGPDGAGGGIDFDPERTDLGPIERIHAWSPAFLDGQSREDPVILLNEWAVPVVLDEAPIGVAVVWINPDSVLPELASFERDAQLATALADLPDGAALVRDAANAAWLTVDGDGLVTPLIPGSTGLEDPVSIDDIAIVAPEPAATVAPPASGTGVALGVAGALLAVLVLALLLPRLRGRAAEGEPVHHHGLGHPADHRADATHPATPDAGVASADTRPIPIIAEAEEPQEAEEPEEPEEPAETEKPGEAEDPETPDAPEEAEDPAEPDAADEPEDADEPDEDPDHDPAEAEPTA